jgi:uncharacterized repeat protein (TIGR02543 family)
MTALKDVEEAGKWNTTPGDYKKIPMWGRIDQLVIDGYTESQSLTMYRMLARIDVDCRQVVLDNKFDLTGVYLYNYNKKGRVAPAFGNLTGSSNSWTFTAPTLPASPSPTGATELAFTGDDLISDIESSDKGTKCRAAIYTFESELQQNSTTPQELTCLVIGGKYRNAANPTYYRVDFRNDAGYFSLLRGHRYFVSVADVKGPGMPTPDDAFNSVPVNITASVLDWRTVNANITGIASDGQKYLGVNQGTFPLDGEAHTTPETNINLLDVITDVTDGWYLEKIADADGDETNASWLTLWTTDGVTQIAKGNKGGNAGTQTSVMLNATQNLTAADRTAYVHLKPGRITYKVMLEQNKWNELYLVTWPTADNVDTWLDPANSSDPSKVEYNMNANLKKLWIASNFNFYISKTDDDGSYVTFTDETKTGSTTANAGKGVEISFYNTNLGTDDPLTATATLQVDPETGGVANKDITLYLRKGWPVTYNLNDGSCPTCPSAYEWGVTYATWPEPTKSGWNFSTWSDAANTIDKIKAGTAVGNMTLTANWSGITTNSYRVENNGGNGANPTTDTPFTTSSSQQTKDITPPTKSYTVSFDVTGASSAEPTPLPSNIAISSWDVTGDTPDGATISESTLTIPANTYGALVGTPTWGSATAITLPAAPTKGGWTFNGWYTASTGGSLAGNAGASYTPDQTRTLYARWTGLTTNSYKVENNGGTGASPTTATPFTTSSSQQTFNITAPTKSVTVNYDYQNGTGSPESATCTATVSSWNVTGDTPDGATISGTTLTIPANTYGTLVGTPSWNAYASTTLPTPTRSNYTFGGWYTGANGSGTHVGNGGDSYTPTNSLTLFAKWTGNTYNFWIIPNGGTGGSPLESSKGTYTYNDASQTITFTPPTNDVTVTFNPNGGTVIPSSRTGSRAISSWSCSNGASATGNTLTIPANTSGDITLTPNWGNFSCSAPSSQTAQSSYTYAGWATSTGRSPNVNFPYDVSTSVTIYLSCYQYGITGTTGRKFKYGSTSGTQTVTFQFTSSFTYSTKPSSNTVIGTWTCTSGRSGSALMYGGTTAGFDATTDELFASNCDDNVPYEFVLLTIPYGSTTASGSETLSCNPVYGNVYK